MFTDIIRDETSLYRPAERSRGGYTLEDGPWAYRLVKENKAIGNDRTDWRFVTDEQTYKDMIDGVKKDNDMAIVMHVSTVLHQQ